MELRTQRQQQSQQQHHQQREQTQQQSPPRNGCKLHVVFRMLDELPRSEAPILHAFQVIEFLQTQAELANLLNFPAKLGKFA